MTTAHAAGRPWRVFYAYTAWTIVALLVMYPLGIAGFLDLGLRAAFAEHPLAMSLLSGQIVLGAWSAWRAMKTWSRSTLPAERGRWDLPRVGHLGSDWTLEGTAVVTVAIAVLLMVTGTDPRILAVSVTPVLGNVGLRWPLPVGVVSSIVASLLLSALGLASREAIAVAAITASGVIAFRSTLWLAAVVRELDVARQSQARLAVAEERLRFARDLHDVTGRDLSAIAVKSELVAQLTEREDPRALEHSREVAQIARASLAEIRGLVRGYREADLEAELRGTTSLLRSAHVQVEVEGDVSDLPSEHADSAAWVLREGGTNILRHADPTKVTITLGADGLRLVNDGAPTDGRVLEGDGLTGMRERLGDRAALVVHRDSGTFTLDVRFDDAGDQR
ncbi:MULTISPECIES: sensor histidine kinase [unclassified Brachybacterium]|uniref:sensor histidine kinase n=1 Tax=unclassified Brachybacterium TaxID=2623841 RepID=UPI003616472E